MLQRVISIKSVGRFKNCAALGDATLKDRRQSVQSRIKLALKITNEQ
jgi:hypothetical protein